MNFDAWWAVDGQPVETGNVKQTGGHSHVVHAVVNIPEPTHVFIKKQTDYATRRSRLCCRAQSVCGREYQNIIAWHQGGLPTLDAVFFDQIQQPLRGVLVTKALDGYIAFDDYCRDISAKQRLALLHTIAALMKRMHQAGWTHRCFYPKHVFVCLANPSEIKMIDLEKARKSWLWVYDYVRDLSAFDRRMDWHDQNERDVFFHAYFRGVPPTWMMYCVNQRKVKKGINYADRCAKGN